ncbi:MAG: ABC transporter ATP-binding protein [Phycisphaerae bacterium]
MSLLLELTRITRRFGNLTALSEVSLRVNAGEVYGILGENGAGKSTLMHLLAGALQPNSGQILLEGRKVVISSPRRAFELGIGMVYQHFKLVGTQTGMENLALFAPGGWWRGVSIEVRRTADRWRRELDWDVDMHRPVERLSVSEQQRIEIIKALSLGGRLLILDEPTAALTPAQVDSLLSTVRRLAERGLTILLVSHKLAEIKSVCDRIMILRRGRTTLEAAADDVSTTQIITAMIGKDISLPNAARATQTGQNVLELEHAEPEHKGRHPLSRSSSILKTASLRVQAGEIVGICGVEGSGQLELSAILTGGTRAAGRLAIDGIPLTKHGARRHLKDMGVIPADRQKEGLILSWSIHNNLALKAHDRRPLSRWGILRRRRWAEHHERIKRQFDIRAGDLRMPVAALSGGNQQKVVVARELELKPGFLLAINPTRGLDVGAAAFVMRQMLAARDSGMGILLIHDDLDELLQLIDRLYVMYVGHLYATPWPDATRRQIGAWMLGNELDTIGSGPHGDPGHGDQRNGPVQP